MDGLVPRHVRGVVFDLWNTLVYNDHWPNPIIALAEAFGVFGELGWAKVIEHGMMRQRLPGIEEGIASLSRATGVTLSPGRIGELRRIWREASRRTRFFEDAPPALERLSSRFRLGLLSTRSRSTSSSWRSGNSPPASTPGSSRATKGS